MAYTIRLWNGKSKLEQERLRLKAILIIDILADKKLSAASVDFFAGFIFLLKDNKIDSREMNYKLFSHATNYGYINEFIKLKIIKRISDGIYSLTSKALEILDKINPKVDTFFQNLPSISHSSQRRDKES